MQRSLRGGRSVKRLSARLIVPVFIAPDPSRRRDKTVFHFHRLRQLDCIHQDAGGCTVRYAVRKLDNSARNVSWKRLSLTTYQSSRS